MNKDLVNILKIGITNSIQSFIPVVIWALLAVVFNDSRFSNGFIITYPYQFIAAILFHIIFKAQLKREVKYKLDNHDNAYSGIKILFCIYMVVYVLSVAFKDNILSALNIDTSNGDIFTFGIFQMFCDWVLFAIAMTEQYDNKNIKAFNTIIFWYISKIICILVLGANKVKSNNVFIFVCTYMLLILVFFITTKCKQKRVIFSLVDGVKYALYDIPSDIGLFAVYILGISFMADNSIAVLSAYNLMAMCTDTQWDILDSAIDTVGTLRVKTGEFLKSRKSLFINSVLYSIVLFISSMILIGVCYLIPSFHNSINFKMVFIMFVIECWGLPLYGIRYMMQSWLVIEHPNGYSFIITIITYVARFTTMLLISSDYRVCLGIVSSCIIGNFCHMFIYFRYIKKDNKIYLNK